MNLRPETRLAHVGSPTFNPETRTAPVNTPVVRTSTVRFQDMNAYDEVCSRHAAGERIASYGRQGLDTHRALEDAISELEQGRHTQLLPSGLSAISYTLLALLSPGDHVLVSDSVYSPVRRIQVALLDRLGIQFSYFPVSEPIGRHVRPTTRLIYAESPSSLLFEVLDLPALSAQARQLGIPLAVDNTWGAGHFYKPLTLGADISIQAGTKYISGHSDLMLGSITTVDDVLARRLAHTNDALGLTISADDAYLALRGVRTLPVRLAQHHLNALQVARHLDERAGIARVFYPALESDPGHALWKRDFSGANGLLSFSFDRAEIPAARAFIDALQLFGIGASWGGFESLVTLIDPQRLAEHSYWQNGDRPAIRLHIGLEHPDDLIEDIEQALTVAGLASPQADTYIQE